MYFVFSTVDESVVEGSEIEDAPVGITKIFSVYKKV